MRLFSKAATVMMLGIACLSVASGQAAKEPVNSTLLLPDYVHQREMLIGLSDQSSFSCSQRRDEPIQRVKCSQDSQLRGQTVDKQCYSCWDPANNKNCTGPLCPSDDCLCNPSHCQPPQGTTCH